MYTLLIVDDESIIRRGIHYHVDWKNHGIEVVGEARDGEDGFSQALKLHPDMIITDIRMPRMNGIQMAEKIRSIFPDIAIIFLTGYEEKEYLLSAIRFGIDDYIMKSANSQNILDAVLRLKERIEKKEEESSAKVEQILNDCMGTIKSGFITMVFSGTATPETIYKQAKIFDFPVMGPEFLPLLVPNSCLREPDNLILALLFDLNRWNPCICFQEPYGIVGFLNLDQAEACLPVFEKIAEELRRSYPEFQMIVGKEFQNFEHASECFSALFRVAEGICWYPEAALLLASKVHLQEIPKDLFYLLESEVIHAYREKNTSEFIGKMEQFYSFASSMTLPLRQYKESFRRMVISFCSSNNSYQDAYQIVNVIDSYEEPEKIFRYVLDSFTEEMPKLVHNAIVESAQEYIREHYAQNIGLKEIATHCHVSPSYISKIFKDDIRIGIIQYIHNIRIEKAKELLRNTDMRVTDIALEVGYSDYKRFSLYFLKIVGISPRDYRRNKKSTS